MFSNTEKTYKFFFSLLCQLKYCSSNIIKYEVGIKPLLYVLSLLSYEGRILMVFGVSLDAA